MEPLSSSDPDRLGRFQLQAVLGSGGMGRVYLGVSRAGEAVAVKVIRPELLDEPDVRLRFAREVQALQAVVGGRVAHFVDADPDGSLPWIAVEYVAGPTLRAHVSAIGVLSPASTAILGAVLAEGLDAIHRCRLLHRDLKPHNIILGPDGPKVIDFGLAVLAERRMELTATGVPVGTPVCMPPEQARGERDLTPAADVYALGASLVFACSGRFPYQAPDVATLLSLVRDPTVHPELAGVPVDLVAPLTAMLTHEHSGRPCLDDVVTALLEVVTAHGLNAVAARQALIAETARGSADAALVPALPQTVEITPPGPTLVIEDPPEYGFSLAPDAAVSPPPEPKHVRGRVIGRIRTAYARDAPL